MSSKKIVEETFMNVLSLESSSKLLVMAMYQIFSFSKTTANAFFIFSGCAFPLLCSMIFQTNNFSIFHIFFPPCFYIVPSVWYSSDHEQHL